MTGPFDALADAYDGGRIGYANEIYHTLVSYGLAPSHTIVDIGCGTGFASGPLIENDYAVTGVDPSPAMLDKAKAHYPQARWVHGTAEKLPFEAASFNVALSAQVFHHVDQSEALAEIRRVLRPHGIVAIWWKNLISENPVKQVRDEVVNDAGLERLNDNWRRGFQAFYAAGFAQTGIRVIPWSTAMPLSRFMLYERSRKIVRDTYGMYADEYFERLESRLRETLGAGDPMLPLAYVHVLYLAKT